MLKRCFSCLLCTVLLLTLCANSIMALAAAGDKTAFTLSVTEGKVGDIVTVSVSLPENSRFTNATMYLHFNTNALAYVEESVYAGKISPKSGTMFMAMEHRNEGYVKCVYATGGVVTKAGILLNFEFEVLSDEPSSFYMTFDECCGANEDDSLFDMDYEVIGCVLNNDGTVEIPSAPPVVTTTTVPPIDSDTTTTSVSQDNPTTTAPSSADTPQTTLPTMVVTDEGNNKITIPVMTTTDTSGNSGTVPVVVVTDANGTTMTVPVTVVTDTKGSVATIPVATATDAQGNITTIPVAIVTNAQGTLETVPVTTGTDAEGNIVTEIVTTTTAPTTPTSSNVSLVGGLLKWAPLVIGIVIVIVAVLLALIVLVIAMMLRKKKANQ